MYGFSSVPDGMECTERRVSHLHSRYTYSFKIAWARHSLPSPKGTLLPQLGGIAGFKDPFKRSLPLESGFRFGFEVIGPADAYAGLSIFVDTSEVVPDSHLYSLDLRVDSPNGTAILLKARKIELRRPRLVLCDYKAKDHIPDGTAAYTTTFIFTLTSRDPLADAPREDLHLQKMLDVSMSSGSFIDTRFYVYSRRGPHGGACKPLPLFLNSTILKDKCAYFDTLLSTAHFSESTLKLLNDGFPPNEEREFLEYDYDSDSDLSETPDLADVMETDNKHGPAMLGRTVVVKDIAYRTLKTLTMYLYTGKISFLHLTSCEARPIARAVERRQGFKCSPKSMYRLADKLGMEDLKRLAFDAIKKDLSEENILEEAFSKFTSTYNEIEIMEVEILKQKSRSPRLVAGMDSIITKGIENGELPHAKRVFAALFKHLASGK
ncbi:hypothetical protein OE88DRAFT_1660058 [Heliocybe sulcata]|uniref:BTB domain-containing protein n=1 Tax=Heliocybe sulcata TaxID=5364 RepID=A0A5C3N3A6_9AGAM|nr:hypothetical protein OE88DRAFT_1660058 [Heliocybe sulcata]